MAVCECLRIQVPDLYCNGYFVPARDWEVRIGVCCGYVKELRYFSGTVGRDSSVSTATRYGLEGPGFEYR
jgi:hypothetical protein